LFVIYFTEWVGKNSEIILRGKGRGTGDKGRETSDKLKKSIFLVGMCDIFPKWVLINMSNYKELDVWRKSKILTIEIYRITDDGSFNKDFSFRDQIRKAAISIPSNIAEGDESGFNKLGIRYFYIAKGSLAELETQLDIANSIGYLDTEVYTILSQKMIIISKMLSKLIQYRLTK
jgi:four helix bundle protein